MAEATLGPTTLPHFLVKQLHPEKYGLSETDLAAAIQEIELQTQLQGSSLLIVHVIDPEWEIINSGLIKADEDGLLTNWRSNSPKAPATSGA